MKTKTISFRTAEEKSKQLDMVAEYLGEDRTYVLNQAIDTIVDIYDWQLKHIKEGLSDVAQKKFVSEKKWRKSLRGEF